MKFEMQASLFTDIIAPALAISTRGGVKDYETEGLVTIEPKPETLSVQADGGRLSGEHSLTNESYVFTEGGKATVKAVDLAAVLSTFRPVDSLLVTHEPGGDLQIRKSTDLEEIQTLPIAQAEVVLSEPDTEPSAEVSVNKDYLLTALPRVLFAGGEEKNRPKFLYWMLRLNQGKMRLAASSGSRLVVLDLEGSSVASSKKGDLCIPVEPTKIAYRLFKDVKADDLTICQYPDGRFVFKCEGLTVNIPGYEVLNKWVDENKFLMRDISCRVTISSADWKQAMSGAVATYNSSEQEKAKRHQKFHKTTILIDPDKKILAVSTKGAMKSNRKLKTSDLKSKSSNPLSITCATNLLKDLSTHINGSEYIQIEVPEPFNAIGFRCYAGDKVSDGDLVHQGLTDLQEQCWMYVARLNEG